MYPELEFLKRRWELGTEEEEGYRTRPPGYIDWRNSFLGIDSEAPYTFENISSVGPVWQPYSYSVPSPHDCSKNSSTAKEDRILLSSYVHSNPAPEKNEIQIA